MVHKTAAAAIQIAVLTKAALDVIPRVAMSHIVSLLAIFCDPDETFTPP
jgi:hypothetical protein